MSISSNIFYLTVNFQTSDARKMMEQVIAEVKRKAPVINIQSLNLIDTPKSERRKEATRMKIW